MTYWYSSLSVSGRGIKLNSISAYSQYSQDDWIDIDYSPYAIWHGHLQENYEQYSQELRLASDTDRDLSWMMGLYWQQSQMEFDGVTFRAFSPLVGGAYHREEDRWLSLFANIRYAFTDALSVDIGGRFSKINKHGEIFSQSGFIDQQWFFSADQQGSNSHL